MRPPPAPPGLALHQVRRQFLQPGEKHAVQDVDAVAVLPEEPQAGVVEDSAGDAIAAGRMPLAIAGFVLAIGGTVSLSRFAE